MEWTQKVNGQTDRLTERQTEAKPLYDPSYNGHIKLTIGRNSVKNVNEKMEKIREPVQKVIIPQNNVGGVMVLILCTLSDYAQ